MSCVAGKCYIDMSLKPKVKLTRKTGLTYEKSWMCFGGTKSDHGDARGIGMVTRQLVEQLSYFGHL